MRRKPVRALLLTVLFALLAWRQWTSRRGAPWVPSSRRDVREMLRLADVGPDDLVVDLGSGDGRVLLEAARSYGASAIGFELDALRVLIARLRVAARGLTGKVRVVRGDLFESDLSRADVVVCYLMQWSNDVLEEKLIEELRPGSRVVSNLWWFGRLRETARNGNGRIRLYEV